MIIRRIGVWSAAKLGAAIGFGIGLVAALILWLASRAGPAAQQGADMTLGFDPSQYGALWVLAVPVVYAIAAAIGAAINALFFNFGAKLMGGLQIETE